MNPLVPKGGADHRKSALADPAIHSRDSRFCSSALELSTVSHSEEPGGCRDSVRLTRPLLVPEPCA